MMHVRKKRRYILAGVGGLAVTLLPSALIAGSSSPSFSLPGTIIAGGGGSMSSGHFALSATTGQPSPIMAADDIPSPPQSDHFNNFPGFWYSMAAEAGCPDLATFALCFGLTSADVNFNGGCDFDGDDDIDGIDLAELITLY
ncbi:MAG: hypothetical protein HY885_06920 [Deltaproteobacteria bacterium]|nr:hypothetical protein [Deltaproteobacteria bacterium]